MEDNNNIESLDDNKVETLDSSTPEVLGEEKKEEVAPAPEAAPAPVETAPVPAPETPTPASAPAPEPTPEPVKEEAKPKKEVSKDEKKRLIIIGAAGVVLIVLAILASLVLSSPGKKEEKPVEEPPKQIKLSDDEVKAILDNYNFRFDGISIDGDECIGNYAFLLVPNGYTVDTIPSEYAAIYIGRYFLYHNIDKDTMTDEEYISIGKKLFGPKYEAELVDSVSRVVFMTHDSTTNTYSVVNGETNYQCVNATVVSKITGHNLVGDRLIVNMNVAYTVTDDDAVYMYKDYNKTRIIGTGNLGKVEYDRVLATDGSNYRFIFDKNGDSYSFNSVKLVS